MEDKIKIVGPFDDKHAFETELNELSKKGWDVFDYRVAHVIYTFESDLIYTALLKRDGAKKRVIGSLCSDGKVTEIEGGYRVTCDCGFYREYIATLRSAEELLHFAEGKAAAHAYALNAHAMGVC